MQTQVTIKTRAVGMKFGCAAVILDASGRTIHETQTRPFGMTHMARKDAETWLKSKGYTTK